MNNIIINTKDVWIVLLSALLFSCTYPVPLSPSKSNYVGLWIASDRYISIFSNGRLEYREKIGFGMHNRVSGNFTFEGNIIEMEMFGSFVIDKPPFEEEGQWIMQMEGILYKRIGPPTRYGKSNNWPEGVK